MPWRWPWVLVVSTEILHPSWGLAMWCSPLSFGVKSCEIKGGDQEMAKTCKPQHHCGRFLAATFDFTTFFTQTFRAAPVFTAWLDLTSFCMA